MAADADALEDGADLLVEADLLGRRGFLLLLREGAGASERQPGGRECAYDGITLRLHRQCEVAWIEEYETRGKV